MVQNKDELELRLATTLSPMLLTVSIFSLTLVEKIGSANTYVDEILSLLSAICILGATMVADSALDKAELSIEDRFRFLGGGYFLFCVISGVMSVVIPLVYISKCVDQSQLKSWHYIVYSCTGFLVTAKLMQNKESCWTVGMFVSAAASLVSTAAL